MTDYSFKISCVNRHTHESVYISNIEGEDYLFANYAEAKEQMDCLTKRMEHTYFVIVEQYN